MSHQTPRKSASKRARNKDKKNRSNAEPIEISFEKYCLSPPNLKSKPDRKRTINESVKAIKHDFHKDKEFEIKWSEADQNWLWMKCKDPKNDEKLGEKIVGMEVQTIFGVGLVRGFRSSDQMYEIRIENKRGMGGPGKITLFTMEFHRKMIPEIFCRILLFLYSRKFMHTLGKDSRKEVVEQFLFEAKYRKIMTQVIDCTGDTDLTSDRDCQDTYLRCCSTTHRYFERPDTIGFVQNMLSDITYYVRIQKFGSCFIQAPCVAISYLLQACGKDVPPANATRLIRHYFDDDLLQKYVTSGGGDSSKVFEILCSRFFRDGPKKKKKSINANSLDDDEGIDLLKKWIKKGPVLVSRFRLPENFECSLPSEFDVYGRWEDVPDIPAGVARFTEYGEPAEFVRFHQPGAQEDELRVKWKESLKTGVTEMTNEINHGEVEMVGRDGEKAKDDASSVATTRSLSEHLSWWSSTSTKDSEDSDDEESSFECSIDGSECSDDVEGSLDGDDDQLHSMILLGCHEEQGTLYWYLQNSWEGPLQNLIISTNFFMESGANLYHYPPENPKDDTDQNVRIDEFCCPSSIAESRLERSDCEAWCDSPDNSEFLQSQGFSGI